MSDIHSLAGCSLDPGFLVVFDAEAMMLPGVSIQRQRNEATISPELRREISVGQAALPRRAPNTAPSQLAIETQLVMDRLLREFIAARPWH